MAVLPVGTATSGVLGTAATTFNVTVATGQSSGDLDLIVVNSQVGGVTAATPSGWTLLSNAADNNVDLRMFGRFHQTGDPATVTITLSGASQASWESASYTGADPVTPTGTPVTLATTTASTALNVGSLTAVQAGSYRITAGGIGTGSVAFSAAPTGYTLVAQGAGGKRSAIAHAANPTPGTVTGPLSWTLASAVRGCTIHLELNSAGTGSVHPPAPAVTAAAPAPSVQSDITIGGTGPAAVTASAPVPSVGQLSGLQSPAATATAAAPVPVVIGRGATIAPAAAVSVALPRPTVVGSAGTVTLGAGTATLLNDGTSTATLWKG
jgi:hypothetical protein